MGGWWLHLADAVASDDKSGLWRGLVRNEFSEGVKSSREKEMR